jgi:hypothetical protein
VPTQGLEGNTVEFNCTAFSKMDGTDGSSNYNKAKKTETLLFRFLHGMANKKWFHVK